MDWLGAYCDTRKPPSQDSDSLFYYSIQSAFGDFLNFCLGGSISKLVCCRCDSCLFPILYTNRCLSALSDAASRHLVILPLLLFLNFVTVPFSYSASITVVAACPLTASTFVILWPRHLLRNRKHSRTCISREDLKQSPHNGKPLGNN